MNVIAAVLMGMVVIMIIFYLYENKKYKAGAYYQITKNPLLSLRKDLGKYGEYLTYRQLKHFENEGAKFLFNVYIPKENGETTEIDVLMITPKGVFVFESKNYSGWIFGSENQKNWYQTLPAGRGKSHKEHFYNPVMQNRSHIKHLKALLKQPMPLYSVIVFSNRCTLKSIAIQSNDIKVINRNQVSYVVSAICNKSSENLLSNDSIMLLYNKLYPYTQVSETKKQEHIKNIEKRIADKPITVPNETKEAVVDEADKTAVSDNAEFNAPSTFENMTNEEPKNEGNTELTENKTEEVCPRCGGKLILRTASKGANAGSQFLGCSNFPKCRYIKSIK